MTETPASAPVVTRFAPSPTGYLHIGGARTAIFNWLFARSRGGKFLLRIEDTDRARHNEDAVDAIISGLNWLGIDWDEEPVSQFANQVRHVEVARTLLEQGKAYRCYLTPEELDAARNQAVAEKRRFESPWRTRNAAEAPTDQPFAIRFMAPQDGETFVEDAVQGTVRFPNTALDDLIIVRSDGAPTYNLAVVVDDHDMGVTHVIRGDDHLNNAARQSQIYQALGWHLPTFAHVPLIHGSDGAKLSKRHGALGVEAYRDMGILPEGLFNYLVRLGWSHGDDEFIPKEKAIEWFGLEAMNKAPSRLDLDKLRATNAPYIAALSDDAFASLAAPFLESDADIDEATRNARLRRAAPFLKSRCQTLGDVIDTAAFLLISRPLEITGKAKKPLGKDGALDLLAKAKNAIAAESLWDDPEKLAGALEALAEAEGIGFGALGGPLRAALTAGKPSPGIGEVLFALGLDESLARITDQLPINS